MKDTDNVELKVCKDCDAPLPYKPLAISFFNNNKEICDDCLIIKKKNLVITGGFELPTH